MELMYIAPILLAITTTQSLALTDEQTQAKIKGI